MSITDRRSEGTQLLPVHVLERLAGDGTRSSAMSVRCPAYLRMAGVVDDCAGCGFGTDVQLSGNAHVACSYPSQLPMLPVTAPASVQRAVRKTRLAAIMTKNVLCFSADVSVEDATAKLLERRISGAPVVDLHGRPIGMVSMTDLLRARYDRTNEVDASQPTARPHDERASGFGFHEETLATATVGEIMTPVVFSLPDTAMLSTAIALMSERRIHRVPIVSGSQLVGILTPIDVMRWLGAAATA